MTRRTTPVSLGIRRAALEAYRRLLAVLEDVEVPCAGRDEWTSEDEEVRRWAARRCKSCPAIGACEAFAEANGEQQGVWAGVDRTRRTTIRRKSA